MPLGYALRTRDILAYYGMERKDIAEAIFRYGKDRRIVVTTDPRVLGGGGGRPGFQSPDEILELAKRYLDKDGNSVPKRYPSFHGTLSMYHARKIADIVIDIDIKGNWREAFKEGRKVLDFLDSYDVPYRIKFSGGSGPHIVIPYSAFPESLQGRNFTQAYQAIFHAIISRSKARHIDGSFANITHFCRLPYSLNEHTGLVSLPIRKEQYDDFTPSMAEIWSVQVDHGWFQEPDESAKSALKEMLRDSLS